MKPIYLGFILSCLVYSLTAIYSTGYYHPDEHYQVIEFAGLETGVNKTTDLAWEYSEQIRSSIQPIIAWLMFSALKPVGIKDPYSLAIALRLLTMLVALSAIQFFIRSTFYLVAAPYRSAYILLSYFLWFLPFLNVRFSSETWSGLSFLVAVALVQPRESWKPRHFLRAGICIGLSFLFRFQSVILAAGLLAWLWFIVRLDRKMILLILAGITLVVIAGVLIDSWFYGHFVCTPWNYFRTNILDGVASSFGVLPWYYFFYTILQRPYYPIGILILCSLIILIIGDRKNFVVWTILPFLLVHSIIPHKENRFLFPVINFIPLLIILSIQRLGSVNIPKIPFWVGRTLIHLLFWPLVVINFIFLAAMTFRPAGNGSKGITEYIHMQYGQRPLNLIATTDSNPYMPYEGLKEAFYAEDSARVTNLDWYGWDSVKIIQPAETNLLILTRKYAGIPANKVMIDSLHFREERQSIPFWIQSLTNLYDSTENENVYILFVHK